MSRVRRVLRAIEPHPGERFKDKLIAVALAFVVWFAVNTEQTIPQLFQFVPLTMVNQPPDLAMASEVPDTVTVRVTGSDRDLQRVSPGMLSPRIDLSEARVGDNTFRLEPEDLDPPTGITVTSIEPPQITIAFEDRLEREVPVSAVASGEPTEGYEVVGRSTDPETIVISGPRSRVEAYERIETATVDVRGRTESFTQTVRLTSGDPFIRLPQNATVELTIDIAESAVTEQFDGVAVTVINNRYQVAVNPQQLGVVLSGPPSVLEQIQAGQLRLVIDAAELQPRAEDYRLEPTVRFARPELGEGVEVVALIPQRVVDVHVFQQPARQ